MRAVALDQAGRPALVDVPEPDGEGALVRVLACGLCGSDVEKIGRAPAGTVLGHEVAAELDGRRVALVHHLPCGECERCLAGHESTCERFRASTIVPGGFAERVRAAAVLDLPDGLDDATATYVEPLACVLRAAELVPPGRVLVVGNGFVGRLFSTVLRRRSDRVFAVDTDPRRGGTTPDGPVGAAVLCAPGGATEAAEALDPGGTLVVFALGAARPRRRLPARAEGRRLPLCDVPAHARRARPPFRPRGAGAHRAAARALRRGARALPEGRGAEGRVHPVTTPV